MMSELLAIFLSIFLGTAHAADQQLALRQVFPTLIPPAEYDHPYTGGVVMVTRLGREALTKRCVIPTAWGCAHHYGPTCEVTIGTDDILVTTSNIRVPWQDIYRHEIAHCNGWPWTHPYVATVKREELPPIGVPSPIPTKPVPVQVIRITGHIYESISQAARRASELGLQ